MVQEKNACTFHAMRILVRFAVFDVIKKLDVYALIDTHPTPHNPPPAHAFSLHGFLTTQTLPAKDELQA